MSSEPQTAYRYAVYAVPAHDTALWELGRRWLGRCAEDDTPLAFAADGSPPPHGWDTWVREPRRYGWHATLKAPFRLREGIVVDDLRASLRALSSHWGALATLPLQVTRLDHFLALCPAEAHVGQALAQACVLELNALADPLSADELARRRGKTALSAREDELLRRWGYPYVMERFRFHYSLTGSLRDLAPPLQHAIHQAASQRFDGLAPQSLGSIALFVEPGPGTNFRLLERF
ncbi:MAG: DUF1045 domain-containing protein [Pseudomonadota bacterium]|nr:DUF1045 domain-containing protein [Pseudomonadota bacterium]